MSTQVPFKGRMKTLSPHKGPLPFPEAINVVNVINQCSKLGVFNSNNHMLCPGQSQKDKCHPGYFSCDTSSSGKELCPLEGPCEHDALKQHFSDIIKLKDHNQENEHCIKLLGLPACPKEGRVQCKLASLT